MRELKVGQEIERWVSLEDAHSPEEEICLVLIVNLRGSRIGRGQSSGPVCEGVSRLN